MIYSYPLIHKLLEVVPRPFTHKVSVPNGVFLPPNALRLVRHIGSLHPHFPSLPVTFTIPGHSLDTALAFVKSMRATVRWNQHRCVPNPLTKDNIVWYTSFGRKNYFKIEFTCPCQGFANPPLNSRKSNHVSDQCGCTASHDPNSHDDMVLSRAPIAVDDWLKERVESGLGWKAIHNLIRTPFIGLIASAEVIPKGLRKFYNRFQYLRQTQVKVIARRDPNIIKSLQLWDQVLTREGWKAHTNFQDDCNFSFAFQSSWQQDLMLQHRTSMILMDTTHNLLSNYFLTDGAKVSLWTFMIRDPIVGKGLPVAWAFTGSAAESAISPLLRWMRDSTGLQTASFMSNCKAKTYLKDRWIEVFDQFRNIVYSQHNPMPALTTFKLQWAKVSPGFGVPAVHACPEGVQGLHALQTGVHGQHTCPAGPHAEPAVLTPFVGVRHAGEGVRGYLPPPERLQIDEVVQVLTDEVESHYQWSQHQVESGFAGQTTNKFQMRQKLIADTHTPEDMEMLGVLCESITGGYIISSFTNPNAMQYTVKKSMVTLTCKMQLASCSCRLDRSQIDLTVEDFETEAQDDNSDIEVLKSTLPSGKVIEVYHPPQRPKQLFGQDSSADEPVLKRPQATNTPTNGIRGSSLAASGGSCLTPLASGSCHLTTSSIPITPHSGAQSHGGSTNSPQELFRLKHNSVGSANVALQQIVAALRLVKTRREMASRATPASLADFVSYSRSLLRMMNGLPSGLEPFMLPGLDWASILDGPEEDTNGSQKMMMVVDGRDYCKLT
ncbi:hypothetical protein PCANC_21783 [Puccinia coronata f. sp. avenae]|uniref:MULE transposase domain-containing protein n=1 Tax=Puccinia coronata f. sp. avenae TaxID=200324 RepID=A0A2N5TTF7_9BASI|nr:hypothetical protein PCANC_21783 [Puccinia coronata f. sp. avenae]